MSNYVIKKKTGVGLDHGHGEPLEIQVLRKWSQLASSLRATLKFSILTHHL